MSEGFVIMQIGNADLDHVCDQVFFPALKATGLEPRRVDRHNTGDLLKSEIVAFLERAEIIVADLTNERPNCYLEVGYAMGLGKKKNLILTVRADHSPTHPNHQRGGPRIHFDLQGYDLLFWDPDKLDEFRAELEKRIRRRLAIVHPSQVATAPAGELQPTFDKEWLDENRVKAQAGLASVGLTGFWEAVAAISPKGTWSQQELLQAENAAQVHTFGWPIGVVIQQDPYRPRPTAGGVVAELAYEPEDSRYSYDYWDVQRTGDFYTLRSLFEDTRSKVPVIYYNTRIVQATELLLFLARLYARLNVSETTSVKVQVTYGGIQNRIMSVIGARFPVMPQRKCLESQVTAEISGTVGELETKIVEHAKALVSPLFTLFDFFYVDDVVLEEIVNKFIKGEVS